jgi:hypothetical protein
MERVQGIKPACRQAGIQGVFNYGMQNAECGIKNPKSAIRIPENPGILESFPHGR